MAQFLTKYYRTFFVICIVAIAGLSFYVGMLYGKQEGGGGVTLACNERVLSRLAIPTQTLAAGKEASVPAVAGVSTSADTTTPDTSPGTQGAFAGSKNGTKYYTPGCAGLDRIKPENLIWFQTAEDATLQGYTPAQC